MRHIAVPPPPAAITRILSRFQREQLSGFIAVAIDLLDVVDQPSDPDVPDFSQRSDGMPGEPEDTEHETTGDTSWPEWHTLPPRLRGSAFLAMDEDVEDEDGGGDCTEDEPGFDRQSRRIANAHGGDGAGCTINGDRELNGDEGDYSEGY